MKKIYFRSVIGGGLTIKQLVFSLFVLSYTDNRSLANGRAGKSITVSKRCFTNL